MKWEGPLPTTMRRLDIGSFSHSWSARTGWYGKILGGWSFEIKIWSQKITTVLDMQSTLYDIHLDSRELVLIGKRMYVCMYRFTNFRTDMDIGNSKNF